MIRVGRRKKLAIALVALCLFGWFFWKPSVKNKPVEAEVQPVSVAKAVVTTVPEYYTSIGTVVPFNSVLVQSRVDGYVTVIHFTEGQEVLAGDILVELDPRPFDIQLQLAKAALARNVALLNEAKLELARHRRLIKEQSVSEQQLQARESLVEQYESAVMADEASIDNAMLQLDYSRVTAAVSGRLGLKNVDIGDLVRASDSRGIVRITQTKPVYVVFTIVEKRIQDILYFLKKAELSMPENPNKSDIGLLVEVWDQQDKNLLSVGHLFTLDNQIDTTTGTVKAKALFENADEVLFPNQFVNVRLLIRTIPNVLTIPTSSVQRGNDDFFVFTVHNGTAAKNGNSTIKTGKVVLQKITPGYETDLVTVVEKGVLFDELVVTDGVDRLREGAFVSYDDKEE